jgi:tRNA(Arg) A34 adenosine deaminase TadA
MEQAIALAQQARTQGNEPFGALLVRGGTVVMTGENKIHTFSDPTYHAELGLIRQFCSEQRISDLSEYTLYTSCEPCIMCSGAMVWSKLGRVVYSVAHEQLAEIAGGSIMIGSAEVFAHSPHRPQLTEKVLNEQGLKVFDGYSF